MKDLVLNNIDIIENGILNLEDAILKINFFSKESGIQREIKRPHVEKIKKSMLENYIPITVKVNQDWYILDGQHSFTALCELKIPNAKVVYNMYNTNGKDHAVCTLLNNNNKSWDANDYLEAFSSLGNENYIWFRTFKNNYDLNHQTALMMIFNISPGGKNTKLNFEFSNGELKISTNEKINAIRIANQLQEIKAIINKKDNKISKSRKFQKAFTKIAYNEKYEHEKMLKKLENYTDKIYHCSGEKAYVKMLNDIYNYKCKEKDKIYF